MKLNCFCWRRTVCLALLTWWSLTTLIAPSPLAIVIAQEINPAGTITNLNQDDGQEDCYGGAVGTGLHFGWANKLKPTSYPATLRTITI